MRVLIDPAWIALIGLAAIRLGVALGFTPVLMAGHVPVRVRVLWTIGLAAVLMMGLALPKSLPPIDNFFSAALTEVLVGSLLAFGVITAFGAVLLAGRLIDLQIGFGVASLIDPTTRSAAPLLGTLLHVAAIVVFFALDGHHLLLRGLLFSFERIPPGTALPQIDGAAVIAQFGGMFVYALMLAAPVMFVLFLIDVAMAVVARTMPQVNVFIVSLPLKVLVGLATLALVVPALNDAFGRIFESMFLYWNRVLT